MQSISDYRAMNYQTVTVSATVQSITSSVTTAGTTLRGQRAIVTAETAQMRYRYDGTDPSATEGHLLEAGQSLEIVGYSDINTFRIIRTGGTSGVIKVTLEVY